MTQPIRLSVIGAVLLFANLLVDGAEVSIQLPLGRTAYQTNEQIDLAVVRSDGQSLAANQLTLDLVGDDGSRMAFAFPVSAAASSDGAARRTEHLHLNGWLLRPGKYSVQVSVDGATATADIELFSHVRQSSFKLINWGRAKGTDQLAEGEDNLGFNVFYGHYADDSEANFIRAGVDFLPCCVMSGGHQMDLRAECDWSDPYVVRGGTRRVVRRAFIDRTRPNVPGIHFYDEPGLTWAKDPVTGESTAHSVPAQHRSYESAFGRPPLPYHQVDPNSQDDVRRWKQWARWKLGFMDAAWQDSQFGVSYVRPDFLSLTQSQYGFSAFSDGYYFNVARSLPVVSGHGGYHDWGPGYFNPSMTLEFARARDFDKPCWYLPTWYGNTSTDVFRLEQYLSFQTNVQGMISPPDIDPYRPDRKPASQGVVESNKLMARLGTIFTTMPVTRPPVALLFSLSHNLQEQTQDMKMCYSHGDDHGANIYFTYLAGKLLQHQFLTVVDEDIVDGTLAANHKAVILTSIDYLDPEVVARLEAFADRGGLVLLTSDCRVKIRGGIDLGLAPGFKPGDKDRKLRQYLDVAGPLADAIRPHLVRAGIEPVFACDQPGVVATRQVAGDVEYLFAVNATHDPQGDPQLGLKAVAASIGLKADGRPIYDAVLGGPVTGFDEQDGRLVGRFRFGPGQMRVFARSQRPIGSVSVSAPVLERDYTSATNPISLNIAAAVVDERGGLLSGSIPLEIRILDPLGSLRHQLYRATDRGTFTMSLPLALNDPPGEWKVTVRELLANSEDTVSFAYATVPECAAAAGATRRAVCFDDDRRNIHRFARVHRDVTIVRGSSDYNAPAAERLAKVLEPWGIQATIVDAQSVNKPRSLTPEEARTWVGLHYAGSGQIKPGDGNQPVQVGFDVDGPVILLGNPEDNPLIELIAKERFLPYEPSQESFPGRARGYIAWQRDAVGAGQESITLIAYDAEGMAEAVGTTYEAAAGIDPVTPLELPVCGEVSPATKADVLPASEIAWQVTLPDRVDAVQADGSELAVLTHDGSITRVNMQGHPTQPVVLEQSAYDQEVSRRRTVTDAAVVAAAQERIGPTRLVKFAVPHDDLTAVACWGGALEIVGRESKVISGNRFSQDITAITWFEKGLAIGLADGRLVALTVK